MIISIAFFLIGLSGVFYLNSKTISDYYLTASYMLWGVFAAMMLGAARELLTMLFTFERNFISWGASVVVCIFLISIGDYLLLKRKPPKEE